MEYTKERPLRLFEICAGYGSQYLALKRLKQTFPEFDVTIAGWCEFDPENAKTPIDSQPAVVAHDALHEDGIGKNWGDLTSIDWTEVPDFDLLTTSTPCQDISAAGLVKGFEKGCGTRSSIIWYVHDCVRIKRPRFILTENVANIISSKHHPTFDAWCAELERLGYVNFLPPSFGTPWKDKKNTREFLLNSADYGVPQHRERMFCVSILKTETDPNPYFEFPKPFPLEVRLRDILEQEVDEKFFLSDEMLVRFCEKSLLESGQTETKQCSSDDGFGDFFVQV